MKMKNQKIINTINLLDSYSEKKLPQKICYAIIKNILLLKNEYDVINKSLEKIFSQYHEYFIVSDDGEVVRNHNGIPTLNDKNKQEEMYTQLLELLNIEVEIPVYTIDMDYFNYNDNGVYDVLTPQDIMTLSSILCDNTKE